MYPFNMHSHWIPSKYHPHWVMRICQKWHIKACTLQSVAGYIFNADYTKLHGIKWSLFSTLKSERWDLVLWGTQIYTFFTHTHTVIQVRSRSAEHLNVLVNLLLCFQHVSNMLARLRFPISLGSVDLSYDFDEHRFIIPDGNYVWKCQNRTRVVVNQSYPLSLHICGDRFWLLKLLPTLVRKKEWGARFQKRLVDICVFPLRRKTLPKQRNTSKPHPLSAAATAAASRGAIIAPPLHPATVACSG